MKTIAVVIPVENHETLSNLLDCISHNIMMPTKIFLINNTPSPIVIPQILPDVGVEIVTPVKPLGINASWRLGFQLARNFQLICMFHDDILISFDFFRKIQQASSIRPMASVYIPSVEKDAKKLNKFMYTNAICESTNNHQGFCFVLRGEFLRDLPVIPATLTTYFGDAWIYFWTSNVWRRPWVKLTNVLAYHHARTDAAPANLYQQEQLAYEAIIKTL